MRKLVLFFCLVVSICAYQQQKYDFQVVLEETEYSNVPEKFQLGYYTPEFTLEDTLKQMADEMEKGYRAVGSTDAIMNEFADKIFANIDNFMIHNGFDPFALPDIHTGFNYTLIITYHGELDLTSGWASDLSSIHRGGDVVVSYSPNDQYLTVSIPIAFDDLQLSYDYSAKIMGLGPKGGVDGKVNDLTISAKIGFNASSLEASLDEFFITNSGHISVQFTGNPLIDWLVNLLTGVVTTLFKKIILLIVEGVVRGGLQAAVDAINDFIQGIINPTTIAPTTTTLATNFFN